MSIFILLEFKISDIEGLGFLVLLCVPIMLLVALILALVKKKRESKRVLIGAGICILIGAGLCGLG